MTTLFVLPMLLTLLAGGVSLFSAWLISLIPSGARRLETSLSSLAAGVLLSNAVLHLMPEAIEAGIDIQTLGWVLFASISAFFVLERLTVWFHHHHEVGTLKPEIWRVLIGDGLHNIIDGFAIATTSMADWRLGVLTALAVGAHEIPQELADFTVLLRSGMSAKKALVLNGLSALMALFGAVLGLYLEHVVENLIPIAIAASAGMFLYIALSDLIPSMHEHGKKESKSKAISQVALFFAGLGSLMLVETLVETLFPGVK